VGEGMNTDFSSDHHLKNKSKTPTDFNVVTYFPLSCTIFGANLFGLPAHFLVESPGTLVTGPGLPLNLAQNLNRFLCHDDNFRFELTIFLDIFERSRNERSCIVTEGRVLFCSVYRF